MRDSVWLSVKHTQNVDNLSAYRLSKSNGREKIEQMAEEIVKDQNKKEMTRQSEADGG